VSIIDAFRRAITIAQSIPAAVERAARINDAFR
jgi:hypothetical protein